MADELLLSDMPEETKRIINAVVGNDTEEIELSYYNDLQRSQEENDTLHDEIDKLQTENEELKATLKAMVRLTDKYDLLVY